MNVSCAMSDPIEPPGAGAGKNRKVLSCFNAAARKYRAETQAPDVMIPHMRLTRRILAVIQRIVRFLARRDAG
jgi:hypothetical protein